MESSSQLNERDAAARLQFLQGLVETPGWALFVATFQGVIQQAKDAARKSESAHQMGMHFGAAMALEQVLSWPVREASMLRGLLQMYGIDKSVNT